MNAPHTGIHIKHNDQQTSPATYIGQYTFSLDSDHEVQHCCEIQDHASTGRFWARSPAMFEDHLLFYGDSYYPHKVSFSGAVLNYILIVEKITNYLIILSYIKNMHKMKLPKILFVLFIFFVFNSSVLAAEPKEIALGNLGSIKLVVPDGWEVKHSLLSVSAAVNTVEIKLRPPHDFPLVLVISPLAAAKDESAAAKWMNETVKRIHDDFIKISVEDTLPIQKINGPHCRAMYISVTDRGVENPSLTDFRYGIQGAGKIGNVVTVFTILTNSKDGKERNHFV